MSSYLNMQNPKLSRRISRRLSSVNETPVVEEVSAELLAKLRRLDEERIEEEKRVENEAAMEEYFRKENERRTEQVTSIPITDQRKCGSGITNQRKCATGITNQRKCASVRSNSQNCVSGISHLRKGISERWLPDIHPNKSLFHVHVLMSYQEVMLTDSYTSPSARGCTRTAGFSQDVSFS